MTDNTDALGGKLIIFEAGGRFALPIGAILEILPYAELSRPPETPGAVAGIVTVGEEAVMVVDIARLRGLKASPPRLTSHMIRLKDVNPALALLVERTVATVDADTLATAAVSDSTTFNGCVTATLLSDGEQVAHLLDPAALLTEEEARRLAEFSARAKQRLNGMEAA
jgi:purine-binding chemotaxis protein CheW